MKDQNNNPHTKYPVPPFPKQDQEVPGTEGQMKPIADHGETSYKGSGKLEGKKAVITGGDSGIGRAVAIAFAREGADVLISYLADIEDHDAEETARYVRQSGRKAVLVKGDIREEVHCKEIIAKAVSELGGIDILVNNAAYQMARREISEIPTEEWLRSFDTNIHPMFYLSKAAEPHLKPGSSIINTTSVNAYSPTPLLLPYAATKGAIQNFTANLSQILLEAGKGIRVNAVAPGPIWTPLIPSTMPEPENFGKDTPMGRPGQPIEVAVAYVFLASDEASYISGATLPVTGGRITI
ncbi:putative oxidoreductase protein, short-chain dehydrogenase reductase (SDR)family [Pedobacter sp. BAL39]|uniref:SDR family oxidoreductase n=1 Tax=Pedobacter sp. BAL39 TaxID=391596 RepID=UPI0001559D3C|nr:SDR family oxidoreductase [Pedobacter sp. BAL39]EDM35507.1 putative oxidoreductase protein, short-chain dehydrogenase reductase (SDR)family [Pedobacter sp. BAL39]